MKYLMFFLTMVIIFLSCKKEETPMGGVLNNKYYYGTCTALKDGIKWGAKVGASYDTIRWKKEAVSIFARYFENNILKESLYFSRVPLKKGNYRLEEVADWDKEQVNIGTQYAIEIENGHVAGYKFLLDTLAPSNRFEVVDYNATSGEIKVKFSATYFIEDRSKAHIIDTVRFTNGEILTKAYN